MLTGAVRDRENVDVQEVDLLYELFARYYRSVTVPHSIGTGKRKTGFFSCETTRAYSGVSPR